MCCQVNRQSRPDVLEANMAKKQKKVTELKIERLEREKLSPEESLKRMQDFPHRKEEFVATIRKGKDRGVYPRSA
jgi:hypothetical protein